MIPTISIDDCARFRTEFYEPQQPVVLSGNPVGDVDPASLAARLSIEGRRRLLWREVPPEVMAGLCEPPRVVTELLSNEAVSRRVRLWVSRRGNVTPWHYDGNGLEGFTLQLKGRKSWRLASPDAGLPCLPFTNVAIPGLARPAAAIEFVLAEGELLFLPRYWFHRVESLEELNINVNWVLTPRHGAANSMVCRREAQLAWLRGTSMRTSAISAAVRLLLELALIPIALYGIVRQASTLQLRKRRS